VDILKNCDPCQKKKKPSKPILDAAGTSTDNNPKELARLALENEQMKQRLDNYEKTQNDILGVLSKLSEQVIVLDTKLVTDSSNTTTLRNSAQTVETPKE